MPFFLPEGTDNGNDQIKGKSRPVPRERLSLQEIIAHLEKMLPVLDLGGTSPQKWIELTSYEDAEVAGHFNRTAIRHFWEDEEGHEGGHPRRWFALLAENDGGHS